MNGVRHGLLAALVSATVGCGYAYELGTHAAISNAAFAQSRLGLNTDLTFSLGLASWVLPNAPRAPFETADGKDLYVDNSGSTSYVRAAASYESQVLRDLLRAALLDDALRLNGWLMRGAIREDDGARGIASIKREPADDPFQNVNRFCNHFIDPTRPTGVTRAYTGVDCLFPDPARDAAQWAIGSDGPFDPSPAPLPNRRNHFTILDAREAMWRALTLQDASGSAVPLTVNGITFSAEDMRRTYWATTFRALGDVIHLVQDSAQPQHTRNEGHGVNNTGYEEYINARARGDRRYFIDGQSLVASAGQLPDLAYSGYAIPRFNRYSDYWSTQINSPNQYWGIADYSNRGFFTFTNNVEHSIYSQPDPHRSSYTTQSVDSGYFGLNAHYLIGSVPDGLPGASPTTNVAMSTEGVFTDQPGVYYALSQRNYDDRAALLIPRAVAYSAGVLDYFFRGKLMITPPDEGVYAFVDHSRFSGDSASATDLNGFAGFNKVRLKIQNATDPVATPTGSQAQVMGSGNLYAIVKFHRNTCYTDDLSGELPGSNTTIGKCRSSKEEIVVSNQMPPVSSVSTDPQEIEFVFAKEIPINAMDTYLQVVFRGQLGTEADAVAVGTIDISEPTYLAITNSQDYIWIGGAAYTRGQIAADPNLINQVQPQSCVDASRQLRDGCLTANATTTVGLTLQVVSSGNVVGSTLFQKTDMALRNYVRIAFLTDANRTDYSDTVLYSLTGCQLGGVPSLVPLQQEAAVVSTDGGTTWTTSDRFGTMQQHRGINGWMQLDCLLSGDGTAPAPGLIPGMTNLLDLHPLSIDQTVWDTPRP